MISRRLIALSAGAAVAIGAPAAIAATSHGITPVSPKQGATITPDKRPVFKMRVKGPGQVFVYVCSKAKRDKKGVICSNIDTVQAKRKKGTLFQGRSHYNENIWPKGPGTYYWQAHRISCEGNINDCLQEGPIVTFKVG